MNLKHLKFTLYSGVFGLKRLKIPLRARVLEIGSGDHPHYRSQVLCDKYVSDSSERGGAVVVDRPFVAADAEHLPFKDGAFDYCICRHVLEHLENPGECLGEMQRVARAGYIESPSRLAETWLGWPYHLWTVGLEQGVLTLRPKETKPFGLFGKPFHDLAGQDPQVSDFIFINKDLFNTSLEWKDRIAWKVTGKAKGRPVKAKLGRITAIPTKKETLPATWRNRLVLLLKGVLRSYYASNHWISLGKLFSLLQCPCCGGEVKSPDGKGLTCVKCRTNYPVIDHVPVFLVPDQKRS